MVDNRIKINEIILVEGKYDKIKLASFFDGVIIETGGFRIFKDKEKMDYIQRVAQNRGAVILTDGDAAGFQIRNFLKREIKGVEVKHAYIPDILGKEKRKETPSAEGKLGVEGMERAILCKALENAGILYGKEQYGTLTKSRLYEDGLVGGQDSADRRRRLAKRLELPERMSANALLEALNAILCEDEYKQLLQELERE